MDHKKKSLLASQGFRTVTASFRLYKNETETNKHFIHNNNNHTKLTPLTDIHPIFIFFFTLFFLNIHIPLYSYLLILINSPSAY